METRETSTRNQALAWWNSLPVWGTPSKEYYIGLYYSDDEVTEERIEEIWRKETKEGSDREIIEEVFPDLKLNQNLLTTREQASKWFSSKSYLEQHELSDKYFESRNPSLLTIKQVEEIWRKEILNQEIQNSIDVESWSNDGSNL